MERTFHSLHHPLRIDAGLGEFARETGYALVRVSDLVRASVPSVVVARYAPRARG